MPENPEIERIRRLTIIRASLNTSDHKDSFGQELDPLFVDDLAGIRMDLEKSLEGL